MTTELNLEVLVSSAVRIKIKVMLHPHMGQKMKNCPPYDLINMQLQILKVNMYYVDCKERNKRTLLVVMGKRKRRTNAPTQ